MNTVTCTNPDSKIELIKGDLLIDPKTKEIYILAFAGSYVAIALNSGNWWKNRNDDIPTAIEGLVFYCRDAEINVINKG
jgi:hypothetical protein